MNILPNPGYILINKTKMTKFNTKGKLLSLNQIRMIATVAKILLLKTVSLLEHTSTTLVKTTLFVAI